MRESKILIFYLFIFVFFIELYLINLKIVGQKAFEYLKITDLIDHSYIESEVLIRTIEKFHEYKMEDFVIESKLGQIYIYYFDEVAYIKFDYDNMIYARLDYDLVYDSCFNYELIPEALFPVVDKLNS